MPRLRQLSILAIVFFAFNLGCQKKTEDAALASGRYLYFASGACYAGGLVGSKPSATTAAGLINRIDVGSQQLQGMPIMDYNSVPNYNYWPVGRDKF